MEYYMRLQHACPLTRVLHRMWPSNARYSGTLPRRLTRPLLPFSKKPVPRSWARRTATSLGWGLLYWIPQPGVTERVRRSLNLHSIHGPVVNPHDLSDHRSAGGSSGGSAAAVAAGLCDA